MLKRLIQSSLARLGYRIVRSSTQADRMPELSAFFAAVKNLGFEPAHILDVGANHGEWTRRALHYFPDAACTLVEPQDHLKSHVRDLFDAGHRIHWVNAGVADANGTLPFTVGPDDTAGSFIGANDQPTSNGHRRIEVPVYTLDEIVGRSAFPPPDLIKIDAEGFDLKAIAGAAKVLGRTEVFLLEAAVCCPHFENTLERCIATMSRHGYVPVDITDLNRSPKHGVLWLCEIAFARRGGRISRVSDYS